MSQDGRRRWRLEVRGAINGEGRGWKFRAWALPEGFDVVPFWVR